MTIIEPRPHPANVDFVWEPINRSPQLLTAEQVRQFDEQYGTEQQQLDFVYFLDGREKVKGALVSDLDSFRASWKRPKWDVLQQ